MAVEMRSGVMQDDRAASEVAVLCRRFWSVESRKFQTDFQTLGRSEDAVVGVVALSATSAWLRTRTHVEQSAKSDLGGTDVRTTLRTWGS